MIFLSCTEDVTLPEQAFATDIEQRTQVSCDPQGVCDPPQQRSWNFNYQGCGIRVYMTVTECPQLDGSLIVYFEEQQQIVDILNGSCQVDINFIEGAYREAVSRHMQNFIMRMPDCNSQDDPVVSSKFIKTNCQKYCYIPVFAVGGSPSYEWLDCSSQESCCIETTDWCVDGEGNKVGTLISEDQVGDCEGEEETCPFANVLSPFESGNSSPNCIADRCE